MSTDDMQRQIISRLLSQREDVAELTLQSWQSLAAELIPIIGEDGFAMLYMRSLHLARANFPWLAVSSVEEPALPRGEAQFILLKTSLQSRVAADAAEASQCLLATFTEILATLIGEPLTNGILRAAWGKHASELTSKDFDHE